MVDCRQNSWGPSILFISIGMVQPFWQHYCFSHVLGFNNVYIIINRYSILHRPASRYDLQACVGLRHTFRCFFQVDTISGLPSNRGYLTLDYTSPWHANSEFMHGLLPARKNGVPDTIPPNTSLFLLRSLLYCTTDEEMSRHISSNVMFHLLSLTAI